MNLRAVQETKFLCSIPAVVIMPLLISLLASITKEGVLFLNRISMQMLGGGTKRKTKRLRLVQVRA